MKRYYQYAYDVIAGKQIAGELIKLSCQRFINDLEREDLIFRENVVDRAIAFIGILKHFEGKHAGENFILQPWQQWIVANIIGFYWRESNTRRFSESYIEVSRKNGKTALAAALCLYFLVADGEAGAEVDLAANSKDQVKKADFKFCSNFAKGLDPKYKYLIPYRDTIPFAKTNSILNVFAADSSKLDGFNASFGLIDEYHEAPNSKVRDVIVSSMGMRENPHLCTITSAGFDKASPCYEMRTTCTEILHGIKQDDSTFIAIYSMDENDSWQDESNWIKCTPNLDVTVTYRYMRDRIKKAINSPSEEVNVKTKNLNVWCDSVMCWIPDNYLLQASQQIDIKRFVDEALKNDTELACYVGVDLSMTCDLTSACFMIPINDMMYFKVHYYLPESVLSSNHKNRELYKEWARLGYLTITPGNVTDYDYITADIQKVGEIIDIYKIFYDKWNATSWAINCTSLGLPLEQFGQNLGNFNGPTKEMERLLLSGKAIIDNNPINRYCYRNVALKFDHNGNCKPDKSNQYKKIDGAIVMLEALGGYMQQPYYNNEITAI